MEEITEEMIGHKKEIMRITETKKKGKGMKKIHKGYWLFWSGRIAEEVNAKKKQD